MDLTWLGWIFVVDMILSTFLHFWRAADGDYVRSSTDSFWLGVFCILYTVGFFTIGFVK